MEVEQSFGGTWTVEKLHILSNYLDFYTNALKNQPFKKIYIDAFAGTGHISTSDGDLQIKGSASLALEANVPFDQYIFIEKRKSYAHELQNLRQGYNSLADRIHIINMDCNDALIQICKGIDWFKNRAVLFLDPYATQLDWATLKTVAQTEAIDVWYLFPFSAVNRMLMKNGNFPESWRDKLNILFGDENWFRQFYQQRSQLCFFETNEKYYKSVDTESLKEYICDRLHSIFPIVANNPRILYNAKNSPLFLFCFAISSTRPSAQRLALKGANYILKSS